VINGYLSFEAAWDDPEFPKSDVVLMDIDLPDKSGIEGLKLLKEKYPNMQVIMLTIHEDDENVFEALRWGAVGYLLKRQIKFDRDVENIIDIVEGGGAIMSPSIAQKVVKTFQPRVELNLPEEDRLSYREIEVLNHLAIGKTYEQIGFELSISINTVRYHIKKTYDKLHAHSKHEAVSKGINSNLIGPPR